MLIDRRRGTLMPVAVAEHKGPARMLTPKELTRAGEQGLFAAAPMRVRVAVATNGSSTIYIDVEASLNAGEVKRFPETRDFNPAVLEDLLEGDAAVAKN